MSWDVTKEHDEVARVFNVKQGFTEDGNFDARIGLGYPAGMDDLQSRCRR
jgi:hypothetical protein